MKTIKEILDEYINGVEWEELKVHEEPEDISEAAIIDIGNVRFYVVDIDKDGIVKLAVMSTCWQCATREDVIIEYLPDLEEREFSTEKAIVELDLVYEVPLELVEVFGRVVSADLNEERYKKIKHYVLDDADIPFSERGLGGSDKGLHKKFKEVEAVRSWDIIATFIV